MLTKTLTLASLVLTSIVAAAQPAQPTPPTPPGPPAGPPPPAVRAACEPIGDIILEIDHEVDPTMNIKMPTSSLQLYAGGSWRMVERDGDGKVTRDATGCMRPADIRTIEKDLKAMKWTVKTGEVACAAVSAGFTEYKSHGKSMWTERVCQLPYLDNASRDLLAEMSNLMVTASTPVKPPCCKH